MSFARKHSQPRGGATIFPSHRFELDLENNGNPLASQLGSLMRLRRRVAAFVGNVTEALKRRLEDFSRPLNRGGGIDQPANNPE